MYKIENNFICNGLKCIVIFNDDYFRCGYVGVPKDHSLFGKDYETVNSKLDVYSGLSYSSDSGSNNNFPINSDLWWFGFACNNLMDGIDIKSAIEYWPENKEEIENYAKRREVRTKLPIKTMDFVEGECKKLAFQLSRY